MTPAEERIWHLKSTLKGGWLNGIGEPISANVAEEAVGVVQLLNDAPHVYPTPDGGIELVWGNNELSIEIEPDKRYIAYINGVVLDEMED